MNNYLPKDLVRVIEDLEKNLELLEQGLPAEDQYDDLVIAKWTALQQQCFAIDDHLQELHLQSGFRSTHEMQEEHVFGLMERFESAIDQVLLHAQKCPDLLYRKISHYGVSTRCRARSIMVLQKVRAQRGTPDNNPFDLLND